MRAIAGLDPQDEGTIEMGGRDVSRLPPAARDFGIVFQSYALFPNLTVAANIGYGLVNRRRPGSEIKARVKELLSLVGLPDQETKYPVQLSGGQQQRVALARALATSPGLLLLDEPLSALDARVRLRLRDQIKDLQRRLGVTTIMVTHDQEEAMSMADRIVVMNQGVIDQVGTPSEIYRHPTTAFVADFVGSMTFIDAEVDSAEGVRVGGLNLHCKDAQKFMQRRAGAARACGRKKCACAISTARRRTSSTPKSSSLDFLGSFCRARLNPEAAPGITILADFSANLMRDLAVTEGQKLAIALPPESLRLFARG